VAQHQVGSGEWFFAIKLKPMEKASHMAVGRL
jgi:hypothetical protein